MSVAAQRADAHVPGERADDAQPSTYSSAVPMEPIPMASAWMMLLFPVRRSHNGGPRDAGRPPEEGGDARI